MTDDDHKRLWGAERRRQEAARESAAGWISQCARFVKEHGCAPDDIFPSGEDRQCPKEQSSPT